MAMVVCASPGYVFHSMDVKFIQSCLFWNYIKSTLFANIQLFPHPGREQLPSFVRLSPPLRIIFFCGISTGQPRWDPATYWTSRVAAATERKKKHKTQSTRQPNADGDISTVDADNNHNHNNNNIIALCQEISTSLLPGQLITPSMK